MSLLLPRAATSASPWERGRELRPPDNGHSARDCFDYLFRVNDVRSSVANTATHLQEKRRYLVLRGYTRGVSIHCVCVALLYGGCGPGRGRGRGSEGLGGASGALAVMAASQVEGSRWTSLKGVFQGSSQGLVAALSPLSFLFGDFLEWKVFVGARRVPRGRHSARRCHPFLRSRSRRRVSLDSSGAAASSACLNIVRTSRTSSCLVG